MCDLDVMGAPSKLSVIRKAAASARHYQEVQGCDFIKGSFFFHEIPMKFHEKQAFHEVSFHMPSVKNNDSTISFHFISRMATRPSFHFISFHGFVK